MRSPADRPRIEGALRAATLVLLTIAAWGRLRPAPVAERAGITADTAALAAWTLGPQADTLTVSVARPPGPAITGWLGALRGAGDAVRWTASFAPLAIT